MQTQWYNATVWIVTKSKCTLFRFKIILYAVTNGGFPWISLYKLTKCNHPFRNINTPQREKGRQWTAWRKHPVFYTAKLERIVSVSTYITWETLFRCKQNWLNSSSYLHPDSNISWNNEGEIKILLIHLQVETPYMKSVIYFHDVHHLSQMCCHFISSNLFSYNVALNIWTQTSTTCSSRETSCVIWCFYIFINTSYLYSECTLSDHWPGHQIQCISSKLRLGRYLRNASSMGVGICLLKVDNSATTICAKTFIAHITVPNVLAADVFGTGIFNDI